jgi:hypothetical protein
MAFLDVFKQKQTAGFGRSFTDQAAELKQALTGKEAAPSTLATSNVGEQLAVAQTNEQQSQQINQAQQVQEKGALEHAQLQQQQNLINIDYRQKESDLVRQVQRQADQVYQKLSDNYSALRAEDKIASLQQLGFLQDLADRKYMSQIQLEGDRRRLDNASQQQEAMLYAAFEDNMALLNSDLGLKRALAADERVFQEYLATINPEAAIQAALTEYTSKQRQEATVGMAKNVSEDIGSYMKSREYKKEENPPVTPAKGYI